MNTYNEILEELKTWHPDILKCLFVELLQNGSVNFTQIAEAYNYYLEKRIKEMEGDQNTSDLTMFAFYCADTLSKSQRKHFNEQIKKQLGKRGWKL